MKNLFKHTFAAAKKISMLGLCGFLFCLSSCEPAEPEFQDITNIDSCLVSMLSYLPYETNQSYTFVNDADNAQWKITPYTENGKFPKVMSSTFGSEWENLIFAEFVVDGIGNLYRSQIAMDVYPEKGGFHVYVGAEIRFDVNSYYYGSYTQVLDTMTFNKFWSADTITIPLNGLDYDKQPTVTLPENAAAYLVKNKGLAEFSIDGGRTYWRLAE